MEKIKLQSLKEKKRTFKEISSLGILQDRVTELEVRIEELESNT